MKIESSLADQVTLVLTVPTWAVLVVSGLLALLVVLDCASIYLKIKIARLQKKLEGT